MVKKGVKITADPNLVNFHFTNTPSTTSSSTGHHHHNNHHHNGVGNRNTSASMTRPRSGSFNNGSNKQNHHKKNTRHHRTAEDRASSRKKISAHMFPLHSSPDHAFVISRCCNTQSSNHQSHQSISQEMNSSHNNNSTNINTSANSNYTFQGPDRPVSWESVRIVKCFTPIAENTDLESCNERMPSAPAYIPCPICLDENCVCPRITKCGHTFCFTCIVHHIQTYHDKTTNPKCPCCSLPIYMNDLRPIQIIPVQSPTTSSSLSSKHSTNMSMQFRKLHRYKYCHTSYIPNPKEPRRLSPNAIPCHTIDNDAIYAKFNYLHVPTYQQLLQTNLDELFKSLRQQQEQQQNHSRRPISMMEDMVFGLTIQFIQSQLHHHNPATNNCASPPSPQLQQHYQDELQLQQQYSNIGSGFYSLQIPSLVYRQAHFKSSNVNEAIRTECESTTATTGAVTTMPLDQAAYHRENQWESASTSWDYDNDVDDNNNNKSNYTNETHPYPNHQTQRQRDRGNSISSVQSCNTSNSKNSYHKRDTHSNHFEAAKDSITTMNGGSMYATDEECILYQSFDGSLCFLSGFNMNCLRTEFASTLPLINHNTVENSMEQLSVNQLWDDDNHPDGTSIQQSPTLSNHHQNTRPTRPPLPDTVEGTIVDIERVLLTPEIRERRRFLSHIPLYTEVCFIEIDISHVLSSRTKHVYKKEFTKRQQTRIAREKAEQREDELLQHLEQEKINERKARMQRIDPMDDFFQPVIPMYDVHVEPNMLSEDFGPAISTNTATHVPAMTSLPGISFSQACQSGEIFPNLSAAPTEMNFPALGSSPPNQKPNMGKKSWIDSATIKNSPHSAAITDDAIAATLTSTEERTVATPAIGKKNKNKKIVLFSTGAHRNDYF